MSGFDIEIVETMVEYLYTSNYTVSMLQETSDSASENNRETKPAQSPIIQALIPHLKMFDIANCYRIDGLKQMAREKIQRTVTKESYYTMSFETARFTYMMTNDSEIRQSIVRHIVDSCSAFNHDHTWSGLTDDTLVIDILKELTSGSLPVLPPRFVLRCSLVRSHPLLVVYKPIVLELFSIKLCCELVVALVAFS